MKLFQVESSGDETIYVVAETWGEAIDRWRAHTGFHAHVEPDSVVLLAYDNLLLPKTLQEPV